MQGCQRKRMSLVFLVVLLLLVLVQHPCLANGCGENGYGQTGENGCVVVYCNEGHHLVNNTCMPCPRGYYSDTQDLDPCRPCVNVPRHASAVRYGEVTPNCLYRCHPGTWSPSCSSLESSLMPLAMLLTAVAGFAYFVHRVKVQKKTR